MKRFPSVLIHTIFLISISLLLATNANAMQFFSGNELTLSNQTFREDVYLSGSILTFNSIVLGDLIAAGLDVFVANTVTEDLLVAGGNVNVVSGVGGDARIFGGNVEISAQIFGDLVIFGGKVTVTENSSILGDVKIRGGVVEFSAPHRSKLEIDAAKIVLNSRIDGDVTIKANEITILDNFQVVGTMNYTSEKYNEKIESRTAGETYYNPMLPEKKSSMFFIAGLGYVLNRISWLFMIMIIGLIVINILPKFSKEVVSNIKNKPIITFLFGILVLIGIPLAILILLLTLIGIPVGIFTGALYAFILVFAKIFSIYFAGIYITTLVFKNNAFAREFFSIKTKSNSKVKLSKKKHGNSEFKERSYCFLTGMLLFSILSFIPFVSFLISSIATVFAIGAFSIAKYNQFLFWKKKDEL